MISLYKINIFPIFSKHSWYIWKIFWSFNAHRFKKILFIILTNAQGNISFLHILAKGYVLRGYEAWFKRNKLSGFWTQLISNIRENVHIQGDQINEAVLFRYLVKSDLSNVHFCTPEKCFGHPVLKKHVLIAVRNLYYMYLFNRGGWDVG